MDRIEYRVDRLRKEFGLNAQDAEDLTQDMLAALLANAPRFDEAKATKRTFVCQVLDYFVLTFVRNRRIRDGHSAMRPLSFNAAFGEGCGDCVRDDGGSDLVDRAALRMDMEAALAPLCRRERLIAEDLKHYGNVTDVARARTMARGSVYRCVTTIRERLIESGIDE
jgi:DNA-directed RNA polymerase specialized sigma24 family protein